MRFKLVSGCFDGSAEKLYFALDTRSNQVVWYSDSMVTVNSLLIILNKRETKLKDK